MEVDVSKVDEARAVVYLRTVYPGDYTVIDKLIQAVREECASKQLGHQAEDGLIDDRVMRCPGLSCDVCPIGGTWYCP